MLCGRKQVEVADSQIYLAIHTGHTRVKFGLFEMAPGERIPRSLSASQVDNDAAFPWDTILPIHNERPVIPVLAGSNRRKSEELRQTWASDLPEPLLLPENSSLPIRIQVDAPEKVGADRLLNAIAVNAITEYSEASIIVDSGTAITVDLVASDGGFLGGAILPGVLMGARALHQFTTTLPLIDGREFITSAPSAIGKNTETAMASGLYWGHLGAVKELIERISLELEVTPRLYITGGAMPILEPYLPNARCEPYLSLWGTTLAAQAILETS